jgi:CRISPR-associated endonuclease/helicase Cas3
VRAGAGRLLGLGADDAARLLVALVALHDLGKFAPAFQVKSPAHWPPALGACNPEHARSGRHTDDGFTLWRHRVSRLAAERLWPNGEYALRALAPAIFGHHGRPVGSRRDTLLTAFGSAGASAAISCAEILLALLSEGPLVAPDLPEERARVASWWVAGLTTVADWVGSNQRWFLYTAPLGNDGSMCAYWERACVAATWAVREAGLVVPRIAPLRSFVQLTGLTEPTPLQHWASTVALPMGPLLAIVEDVTGAGKTEAAQMLAHRILAEGRASGVYWALPTQATANAMYARQARTLDALYLHDGNVKPSLVLAHGQQRLHEGFRRTVLGEAARVSEPIDARESEDAEISSSTACAAFLADDRRAALLADVGAGTVDQALLGVLPSKFNAVRLFALSDKVIVVDEAHAYDAYMGVEVQELLRFQAALGGCAVVLSATLSQKQREQMVAAWTEGLAGGRRSAALWQSKKADAYPLATLVGGDPSTVQEIRLAAASWSRRRVGVRLVSRLEDALEHVVDAQGRGGTVAWVRNTVDDCLAAAALLRERGIDPVIFHARFAQGDRQTREREVLALFGKDTSPEERRAKVLVATQVVEQSLDLDFDAMVSDVAPADLLVQRAGRLWRHPNRDAERPAAMACELIVLAPAFAEEPDKDWLGGTFSGTAHVYEDVGVLWRTVRALARTAVIETPDGLRALIEAVYGNSDVPPSLLPIAQRAEGKEKGNAATANYATLNVTDGYDASAVGWVSDIRAPTRLGDQQTTVRLARVLDDGTLAPWVSEDGPAWKAWALSEVRLSSWKVPVGSQAEPRYDPAVARARAEWGRFEQEIPVIPLASTVSNAFQGRVARPGGKKPLTIEYDDRVGLTYCNA